ncbi:MAG: hypothetical protein KBD78_06115 [Oligoflexales bacterium]|nr:hypothetical protein [Oligoflexales bacterium]
MSKLISLIFHNLVSTKKAVSQIFLKKLLVSLAMLTVGLTSACNDKIDNKLKKYQLENPEYETSIDEVKAGVDDVASASGQLNQGFQLSGETREAADALLSSLEQNSLPVSVEDLPEWQELAFSLTDDQARSDINSGYGIEEKKTNFYKQQLEIDDHKSKSASDRTVLDEQLIRTASNAAIIKGRDRDLQDMRENLTLINSNFVSYDTRIKEQLSVFEFRLSAIETLIQDRAAEIEEFRASSIAAVSGFKEQALELESQIRRYNPASMAQVVTDHSNRIERDKETISTMVTETNELVTSSNKEGDTLSGLKVEVQKAWENIENLSLLMQQVENFQAAVLLIPDQAREISSALIDLKTKVDMNSGQREETIKNIQLLNDKLADITLELQGLGLQIQALNEAIALL